MTVLFVVVGALAVFAIAAVLVGGETFRLSRTPSATIFDIDEALYHVATGLSPEAAAGLTMDEARQLIGFGLDHLRDKGLSARPGEDLGRPADTPVVVDEDDTVAVVLGRAEEAGMEVGDIAVVEVVDLLLAHLADIGGLGPRAGETD